MLVSIDAAAERSLRVVQVKGTQPVESDEPAELCEGRCVSFRRAKVVARCDQMAGVQADTHAAMVVHLRDDRRELFERRAECRSLPGRVLEKDHRLTPTPGAQQLEQRIGYERQSFRFAPDRVSAGMEDDAEQAERFGAIEFVTHRLHRLPAQRRVRGGEVDQVAGVRHDRPDAGRFHLRAELANLLARKHRAHATGSRSSRRSAAHRTGARPLAPPPAAVRPPPTYARPGEAQQDRTSG